MRHGSSPVFTGEGDRRKAVEGATTTSEFAVAPSTTLCVVPLPRFAEEDHGRHRIARSRSFA